MTTILENDSSVLRHDRGLALWEIVSVVVSGLIAEWVVLSFVGAGKLVIAIPIVLALILMIYSHLERDESPRDIGFRTDNFLSAAHWLLLPTIAAVVIIVVAAWLTADSFVVSHWRWRFLLLPLWALFQQYVLNGYINRRAQIAFGNGLTSILLVGLVFGVLHLPNPLLAAFTVAGGILSAVAYQRWPNLFALAISHAVISLTIALTFPDSLINSLRVGFKYFR